jgi:anaerobic magnesium-protoporphyrin IX monomethyl ester cyclase
MPHPDRADFPGMKIRDFIASRGCANSCAYCFNSTWNKMFPSIAGVRTRSVEDVIKELQSIPDAEFFYAQDSCFLPNIKHMRAFSSLYRRKINIPYHVHLRPNQVNEERVLLLHDSNCVSVKIALETTSDRLRKLINRGNTKNTDAYIAARLLRKWNIALILQNMIGLPTATIEDDLETLEVNIKCRPAYAWVSIFQPYPATELSKYCEKEKIYTGDYSEIGDNFFDKSVLNISEEHKEQVAVLQRIFAFCAEMQVMPKVSDLTWERMPKFVHNAMRKVGDKRMFPNVTLPPS